MPSSVPSKFLLLSLTPYHSVTMSSVLCFGVFDSTRMMRTLLLLSISWWSSLCSICGLLVRLTSCVTFLGLKVFPGCLLLLTSLFNCQQTPVFSLPWLSSPSHHGLSLKKLTVSWADDLYDDPSPSIASHTRNKKQQSKSKDSHRKTGKK
ncbi:unnamed protein product [Eruca vesicaria subsp. sativa]|uniref:Uncharacterized protein n=1 Tax=Eruca vesicaria subsp. sativa TaxID=29727 RepID=A0ABC8LTK2_ERUVS|nr:unnamed protein product [Eruca vesicaria subsp. sativa]